jgi:hypothetical protein
MNGTILQSPAALTHQGRQLRHYCFKLSNHASVYTIEWHDQGNRHVGCCSPVAQPETLLHVCQQRLSNNDDISYSTRRQQSLAAAHQPESWKRGDGSSSTVRDMVGISNEKRGASKLCSS